MNTEPQHVDLEALVRYESAMVDADIEGIARDPEAEALIAKWREQGLSPEERIKRLIDFYQGRQLRAAE